LRGKKGGSAAGDLLSGHKRNEKFWSKQKGGSGEIDEATGFRDARENVGFAQATRRSVFCLKGSSALIRRDFFKVKKEGRNINKAPRKEKT